LSLVDCVERLPHGVELTLMACSDFLGLVGLSSEPAESLELRAIEESEGLS
jgi:hypothetical protein